MISYSPILPMNASVGKGPEAFHRIHEQEINIAIQQRSVGHLEAALEALLEADVSIKAIGTTAEILEALRGHLDREGLSDSPVLKDIESLLQNFQEVTGARVFRILLSTVHSNMCKRFHTDINDLRMLCTYSGKGTLWVAESPDVKTTLDGENGNADPHPDSIRQAKAGEVLILKGALYPNARPVVHRSPSIEAEGKVRLLLRIDTNESLFA